MRFKGMKLAFVLGGAALVNSQVSLALDGGERDELRVHLRWCLTHDGSHPNQAGIELFQSGTDNFLPLARLRIAFLICQQHHNNASRLIKAATDREFTEELSRVKFDAQDKVERHLKWVADERNQFAAFREAGFAGDASTIRHIYKFYQAHNKEALMLLRSVSDPFLIELSRNL